MISLHANPRLSGGGGTKIGVGNQAAVVPQVSVHHPKNVSYDVIIFWSLKAENRKHLVTKADTVYSLGAEGTS